LDSWPSFWPFSQACRRRRPVTGRRRPSPECRRSMAPISTCSAAMRAAARATSP